MPNRILTNPGWEDRIRAKVGVDDSYLPDAVLQVPDVITVAEARVVKAVPTYATLTDDDRVFLEAATVCACAVQVIATMSARLPSRQKGPSGEYEVTVDWTARRRELLEEYERHLGELDTTTDYGSGFFALGGPQR
jgi:hypothetical protein